MSAAPPPPSPASSPRTVACPACGLQLNVRAEDVGKRGKCTKCGEVFRISEPTADSSQGADAKAPKTRVPPAATTVTFPCELCATRITMRVEYVGRAVKCPDCGRRNVIPPPEPAEQVKTPRAMDGAQFELWGVDNAPSTESLKARTPTLHPVECGLCQTLMYATDVQIGKKLKCPDCGALTGAQARTPEKPHGPVMTPDGEEYQLDEAPTARPVVVPVAVRVAAIHDAARKSGEPHKEAIASSRAQLMIEAPELPAVPLVQGVHRMLLSFSVLVRWIVLSLFLTVVATIILGGLITTSPFFMLALYAGTFILGALWMLGAFPVLVAIVLESSEGNDRLEDPPNWLAFETGEAFFLGVAIAVSTIPAWLSLKATAWIAANTTTSVTGEEQAGIAVGTFLLVFPVVLLSNLEQGAAFAIFSPRLGMSLLRCLGAWLLFYAETAMLVGGVVFATAFLARQHPALLLLVPPMCMGVAIIYMRLLGRLAWWIAERMPPLNEGAIHPNGG